MRLATALAALALAGCGADAAPHEVTAISEQALMGETAVGSVPSGLPARFMLGLNEGRGGTWMSGSGVPWDMRYQYLSKNWVTNWGHGDHDGQYALDFFYDTYDRGMLPAVQFYQIVEEQPAGEDTMLTKLADGATMSSYFTDFKILLERIKDYGGPVAVMVEADGYGFAQIQSQGNPDAYAAVAASGLPELAELPNTVAGWGMAYLQMKKAVGADNALLGIHVSAWATNRDVMMNHESTDLAAEVDETYWFLAELGLRENVTGLTYDFLVGDPSDRDAAYYEKVLGQERWWDADDGASIATRSFNRFAEWLRLWNEKSGKRWVLWQLPLGNSNHLDVENAGASRQGYRDNRPEYFLGDGQAHLQKFADAGAIALLFGAGMHGMSTFDNDLYTDGQLFMKSRGAAIYASGAMDIAPGQEWTSTETGPTPRPEGEPLDPTYDETIPAQYTFEGGSPEQTQNWTFDGTLVSSVETTAEQAFAGAGALAARLTGEAGKVKVLVKNPAVQPGTPYALFRIFLPEGHGLSSILPYVQQAPSSGYAWTTTWVDATTLETGVWHTIAVHLPAEAILPASEMGIELTGDGSGPITVYVDDVAWPEGVAVAGGGGTATPGASSGSGGGTSSGGSTLPEDGPPAARSGCTVASVPPGSSGFALALLGLLPLLRRRRRSA
jgi:MYXO-CTERM domain-containing protein